MKTFPAAVSMSLLILTLSWGPLPCQESGRVQLHIDGGVIWGNFHEINESKGLKAADTSEAGMEPNPFGFGFTGSAGISYSLSERQGIRVEGAYEHFEANARLRFGTVEEPDLGIHDFPVYRVRNIPLSFSYILRSRVGPFDLSAGPGVGYQWTRYVEQYPTYGLTNDSQGEEEEYVYSGSAPIFTIRGAAVLDLSDRVAISIPFGYRYANVKEMTLSSYKLTRPNDSVLVDSTGEKVPIDLSGFTLRVGLDFRFGGGS